jgi:membrane protease YdiL (CAAX protease family)
LVAPTLRDVSWRWRDLLIGLIPLIALPAAQSVIKNPAASRWLWPISALLAMAWMLGYPLLIARMSKLVIPRPRRILIEAMIALPIVLGVMVVMSLVATALTMALGESAFRPLDSVAGSRSRFDRIFLIVLGVILAPLAEETFFRGMLYNALRQRMHWFFAAMLQGIAFGFYHPFGTPERVAIAVGGFSIALFYEWRKTLLAPILFHSIMNSLGLTLLYLSAAAYADAPVLGVRGDAHDRGCLVTEVVPGGSAADAGLRVGDIITGAGENSVRNLSDLILIMRTKKVGNKIPIWYLRDGEPLQVEALLKGRPK